MSKYFKIEKNYFLQLFKLISANEADGIKYYKYSSIIFDHLKTPPLRTMNDYMNNDDYEFLITNSTEINQEEMENLMLEKIPNEGLDSIDLYNNYYNIIIDYYRAKKISRSNTDKIIKENASRNFYTVIEEESISNLVYDKKESILELKNIILRENNLIKHFLFQKAHNEALSQYIQNKIKIK